MSDIGVPECPWNILCGATSSITVVPPASMGMVDQHCSQGVLVQVQRLQGVSGVPTYVLHEASRCYLVNPQAQAIHLGC